MHMGLQVGQEVQHSQFGKGVVTSLIDDTKVRAQFEGEEFEKIISPKFLKGYVSVGDSIMSIRPSDLPVAFLEYLHTVKVEIRIHYPAHAQPYVFSLFSREGIDLPEDIRPLKSGSRGGVTIQRTLAGEMWFPTPEDWSFIPTPYSERDGQVKLSSLAVIMSVLKDGFSITKYTKT
jgi:hypothetical protein